jgi:hypothetical protein
MIKYEKEALKNKNKKNYRQGDLNHGMPLCARGLMIKCEKISKE